MSVRRTTLRTAGSVAVLAGGLQALTGLSGVYGVTTRDRADVPTGLAGRNLDSELRFYAVWYAAAGLLMHAAAHDADLDRGLAAVLPVTWFAAGASRLLSMRAVGRPATLFTTLAVLEFGVAGILAATRAGSDE